MKLRTCLPLVRTSAWRTSALSSCQGLSLSFKHETESRSFHQLASCREWTSSVWNKRGYVTPMQLGYWMQQKQVKKDQSSLIIARTMTMFGEMFNKKKPPLYYHKLDNVKSHYELVYQSGVASYVQGAMGTIQLVGVGVCAAIFASFLDLPMSVMRLGEYFDEPYQLGIFTAINIVLCFFVAKACKMCALRMYYSDLEDKFIIIFVGIHPLSFQKVIVIPGEVQPILPNAIMQQTIPWADDIYSLPSRKIIMFVHSFTSPAYFNKLLGYKK